MRLSPMFQFGDMFCHCIGRYVWTIYSVISTLQRHDMDMHMPHVVNQITKLDGVLLIASLILICFCHFPFCPSIYSFMTRSVTLPQVLTNLERVQSEGKRLLRDGYSSRKILEVYPLIFSNNLICRNL